ncbi:MAG: hypothetical protein ATN36_04820 [Epulopiscium sp. Nele67-Bin005]|nr:MAG: hypothetical protein ATN36_04820 [Epulopiscium sp. Nele67-Bin005]
MNISTSMMNSYYSTELLSTSTNNQTTQTEQYSDVATQLGTASSTSSNTSTYNNWENYVSVVEPDGTRDYYEVSYVDSDGNNVTEKIKLDQINGHGTSFAELAVLSSAGYISQDIGTLLEEQFMDENGEIDFNKTVDSLRTVGDTIRDNLHGGDYATAMKFMGEGKTLNDFFNDTDENDPMTHFLRFMQINSTYSDDSLLEMLA